MSTALRIANAIAEARLRVVAELVALGTPMDCIGYWTHRVNQTPCGPRAKFATSGKVIGNLCGVTVCGLLACEVRAIKITDELVVVSHGWCGSDPSREVTAHAWVPDAMTVAFWHRRAVKHGECTC